MKIGIVGAGMVGLTTAYRLSKNGHQVVIFEKNSFPGGLAAGFKEKGWDWPLEESYHHLFSSDKAILDLLQELDLADQVFFSQPKTSIFYHNKISQFDSPLSLLTFPHLEFKDKLQSALATLYLKVTDDWRSLEKTPASSWLPKYYGQRSYQTLWESLLESKFGSSKNEIPMSWFWARIKKRSRALGYLEGGFQTLIDKLTEEIRKNGGQIYLGRPIRRFNDLNHFSKPDRIIFTIPTSSFLSICPDLPPVYKNKLKKLKMIGALNLILILKEKFLTDNTYWLNINEEGFPFVAVVEHTNFIDPAHYGGNHLLYIGGYYPQIHRYFKMKNDQILKEFLPYLQKINPDSPLQITNYYLFKNLFAQPIIPINYSQLLPLHQTPIPNVYLANMQQVYPWDRGTNYAVELGEKIAHEIS